MPTPIINIRHYFDGGWATDYGPTTDVTPNEAGHVAIPFLVDAENVYYELDGGPHKIGGTEKVNSSAVASGAVITGCYDYWRQGTGGSPTRRRIIHAGTKVFSDGDDGVFSTELFTGLTSGAVPNYSTFDDILIIASDASGDVPKSWDGTTAQNLAGTPPRFSFSVTHKGRQFAAGVYANPSTLYYSVAFDPEDWAGAGSGTIRIDPNDGDMITGIVSFKDELIIFKGPNKGSIHRLTGSSSSDFVVTPFVRGIGAAWQNGIFQFKDDLGFVSQFGTIHSLKATAAYGDFNESALSLPIHKWFKEHLNNSRLRYISAANDPLNGWVLFTMSIDASSTNNAILMMDYRNWPDKPVKWAYWSAIAAGSIGLFVDTNGLRRILAGGNDGYLRRINIGLRSLDGVTAISSKVTTPYFNYGDPMRMKTIYRGSVGLIPKGDYTLTFGWTRDDNAQQTQEVSQGGGDVLGPADDNQFTLGTSTLAGSQFVDRYFELQEGGEFRAIQYQVRQNGTNEDMEVHGISASILGGAISTENN